MAKLLDNPAQSGNSFTPQWIYKLWIAVTQGLVLSLASQSIGTATLVAGTVTVPSKVVQTNSLVMVSIQNPSSPGVLSVPVANIVAGTSFQIHSTSGTDASTVSWVIVQPV